MDLIRIFPTCAACMQSVEQLQWGDTDHLDHLQLLRGARNSVNGDGTQGYLLASLQERVK